MEKLDCVTLLCLDTRDPDAAVLGMQKCMQHIEFASAVLVTNAGYLPKDPRIVVRAIEAINSIEAYSHFMIKEVGAFFGTSHVLIAQWDGFVANPQAWSNQFLDFDYIGAPWMNHRFAVGNGGFSLRSRKLIDALKDPAISDLDPEDFAICDRYHDLLVHRYGIRFAPIDVARRFSCETYKPPELSFGVHGVGSVHWVTSDLEHLEFLRRVPEAQLLAATGRTLAKDCIDTDKPLSAKFLLNLRAAKGPFKQKMDVAKLRLRLFFGIKRIRQIEPIGSVHEPDDWVCQRPGALNSLILTLKQFLQRDLVLLLTGQSLLKVCRIPTHVKKILWIYDWHMLGDCRLDKDLNRLLEIRYQVDVCCPTGPLTSFQHNPAIHSVFRSLEECSNSYDLVVLNDINSRSIRTKLKRFVLKPWAVLVAEPNFRVYRASDFVSRQISALIGQGPA